jgi:hypothetical protein
MNKLNAPSKKKGRLQKKRKLVDVPVVEVIEDNLVDPPTNSNDVEAPANSNDEEDALPPPDMDDSDFEGQRGVPRRRSGGSTLNTIGILDSLDEELQCDEFTPNLPPPSATQFELPVPVTTEVPNLHIPPQLYDIGKSNPEILLAFINNHSKQLDVKKAQIEAGFSGVNISSGRVFGSNVKASSRTKGATVVDSKQQDSNPWFSSEYAEVSDINSLFNRYAYVDPPPNPPTPKQTTLKDLAKAFQNCTAGNLLPIYFDDIVYATVKCLLRPESEKIDCMFSQFDDWWFFKSNESSKEKQSGGRQRFRNKLNSQIGSNQGVSR